MKNLFFVALFFFFVVAINAAPVPPRPKLSEVFSSQLSVQFTTQERPFFGEGVWASNQPKGDGVEHFLFPEVYATEYRLQRYDLGFIYRVYNLTYCEKDAVNGTLPLWWGWLAQANYSGRSTIEHRTLDVWELTLGYATVGLAVDPENPDFPVWYWRYSQQRNVSYFFVSWLPEAPSAFYFNVPSQCQGTRLSKVIGSPVGCLSRNNMMEVARNADVLGFKKTSAGFVSKVWGLDQPLSLSELNLVTRQISQEELREGDVLLGNEHVVVFGGWANEDRTKYIAYEYTPREGVVQRVTPYPYWYNGADFVPSTYRNSC